MKFNPTSNLMITLASWILYEGLKIHCIKGNFAIVYRSQVRSYDLHDSLSFPWKKSLIRRSRLVASDIETDRSRVF